MLAAALLSCPGHPTQTTDRRSPYFLLHPEWVLGGVGSSCYNRVGRSKPKENKRKREDQVRVRTICKIHSVVLGAEAW